MNDFERFLWHEANVQLLLTLESKSSISGHNNILFVFDRSALRWKISPRSSYQGNISTARRRHVGAIFDCLSVDENLLHFGMHYNLSCKLSINSSWGLIKGRRIDRTLVSLKRWERSIRRQSIKLQSWFSFWSVTLCYQTKLTRLQPL